jgi:formamidase
LRLGWSSRSPDIPAYCTVKQNEVFKVECHDWTGGQISNNDTSDDIQVGVAG